MGQTVLEPFNAFLLVEPSITTLSFARVPPSAGQQWGRQFKKNCLPLYNIYSIFEFYTFAFRFSEVYNSNIKMKPGIKLFRLGFN